MRLNLSIFCCLAETATLSCISEKVHLAETAPHLLYLKFITFYLGFGQYFDALNTRLGLNTTFTIPLPSETANHRNLVYCRFALLVGITEEISAGVIGAVEHVFAILKILRITIINLNFGYASECLQW